MTATATVTVVARDTDRVSRGAGAELADCPSSTSRIAGRKAPFCTAHHQQPFCLRGQHAVPNCLLLRTLILIVTISLSHSLLISYCMYTSQYLFARHVSRESECSYLYQVLPRCIHLKEVQTMRMSKHHIRKRFECGVLVHVQQQHCRNVRHPLDVTAQQLPMS